MKPKGAESELRSRSFRLPKRFENTDSFFYDVGVPLDAFGNHFRRIFAVLGFLWPPSGCLFGSLWKFLGPPRTCRDSAENLPRFRRESAKNQPRTRRMNPKQSCLSHSAFFEWTAFSDKRFDKIAENKSGAAVSPLGGLQLNRDRTGETRTDPLTNRPEPNGTVGILHVVEP